MVNRPELEHILQRLERMEQQNQRLKRSWAVIAIGPASIVVMGQVASPKIPNVIEA